MARVDNEVLQPQYERARTVLATALGEACAVDVGRASTDELVRIEETLETARNAAKEVVSIRLMRRQRRTRGTKQSTPKASAPADMAPAVTQRIFDDIRGRRWRVFAVHPSATTIESGALPESFRDGWLSFESGDEKRRVAPIPPAWEELPMDELQLLCHRAERASKRTSGRTNPPPESTSI